MNKDYEKIKIILNEIEKIDAKYERAIQAYRDGLSDKDKSLKEIFDTLPFNNMLRNDFLDYFNSIDTLRNSLNFSSQEYKTQFELKRNLLKKLNGPKGEIQN